MIGWMGWIPQHSNVIILQRLLQASGKIVASEGGNACSLLFWWMRFRPVSSFWSARFLVDGSLGWMGLSGGWGPLPIPSARFPGERILIDPLVGTLLDYARHNGPQQRKLVRCVLSVPGWQGCHYEHIYKLHQDSGYFTVDQNYSLTGIIIFAR